jgi:hypothetical protein
MNQSQNFKQKRPSQLWLGVHVDEMLTAQSLLNQDATNDAVFAGYHGQRDAGIGLMPTNRSFTSRDAGALGTLK